MVAVATLVTVACCVERPSATQPADETSCATDGRETSRGSSAPLGLADHQGRHQLRGTPAVPDVDGTATARIPTEEEELCLQEETVFFLSAEHSLLGS